MKRISRWEVLKRAWRFRASTNCLEITTPFFALKLSDWSKNLYMDVAEKGWRIEYGIREWWNEGLDPGRQLFEHVVEDMRYQSRRDVFVKGWRP